MPDESRDDLGGDIEVLRRQQHEIVRLSRLYSALSHINQSIVRLPDRNELFVQICRHLVERGGMRLAWIGWHDPDSMKLVPVAQAGDTDGYLASISIYVVDDRPEGRGPAGLAFRNERPYISNDLGTEPSTLRWRAEMERRGFKSMATFPIRLGARVAGVLAVYADRVDFFQDQEVALLSEAAADISFALDNLARDEDRQRAEAAVRRERMFSDSMIDSMPGILYFYDRTGQFLRWNRSFEIASGRTSAEIARMHPLEFFREEDQQLLSDRISEVFHKGEASVEAPFLAKDGTATPYFLTGRKVSIDGRSCLVGVGLDVTERRRAEDERRLSEARYRTLFEYAPDGILISDEQANYLDANATMCRMLGYSREELLGMNGADIVAGPEIEHIDSALAEVASNADHRREWIFRRKDGSTFPADVIATMMPDGNVLGMVRDITERKAAELALRDVNRTLELKVKERTSELEAAVERAEKADRIKSAFLATMSHELRTPLNSIIGFTGIVLQRLAGPLNDEQAKQLGMVRGSARHLLDLINDVLDISKIEAGQFEIREEAFDLSALVDRAVESVRPLADAKGLQLVCRRADGPELMRGDRRRVEQILINLLANAIKFTERGEVTLHVDTVADYRNARRGAPTPAVRLRIRDSGIGIRPEHLQLLFQPFQQLDTGLARQHEGTGLGLAICQRLAVLMGGEISVESTWQKGSEFTVTLPIAGAGTE